MIVAKWHVRRTSRSPKALSVALSFYCLLGLGCPKQAFAKIAISRSIVKSKEHLLLDDSVESIGLVPKKVKTESLPI
jgi:hypothetical protein